MNWTPEEDITGWQNMVKARQSRIDKGETVPVLDPYYLQANNYQPKDCSRKKTSYKPP